MDADKRREQIAALLRKSSEPVVARTLAKHFDVSRQVIVGDIALLRASGLDIFSTPKGYVMREARQKDPTVQLVCIHSPEETKEELYTVVDNGGEVLDVLVEHPVYGVMRGELNISSRLEVDEFIKKIEIHDTSLLSALTEGIHTHTIAAKSQTLLDKIEQELKMKGFLYQ
ncbi:transcription repressor NadR [Alkalibacterium iburiense]|uniref:Transcription repressor NadR n=1 Tax=Alkalibacterium iburiense TaxID=290589 RepID=A0ABN0XPU7_9LACT